MDGRDECNVRMSVNGVVHVLLYVIVEEVTQRDCRQWFTLGGNTKDILRRRVPPQTQVEQKFGWEW